MMARGRSDHTTRCGRERGGCLLRLMVLAAIVGAMGSLVWMALLPLVFTRMLRDRTGFAAEIASLSANPFTGRVTLRGLVVTNPPTFADRDFLQLRSFEADVAMWTIFSERVAIDTLTLDMRQLSLVRRAGGATNLEAFRAQLAGSESGPAGPKSPVVIRKLRMRFDTLVLADYTEAKPHVRTYRLGLDQEFLNISNLGQLFAPAVLRGLVERDAASDLAVFLPTDLNALLGDAAKTGRSEFKSAERKSNDTFREFLDKLEEKRKP
jgi:hypothetical protein